MPNYLHHTFEGGGLAIWHITESAEELRALLATNKYDAQLAEKRCEARRAEWLAVRLLLSQVLGEDKMIAYHPSGRPYLTDGSWHISVSHTQGYAAIAYHRNRRVGVDIEYISSRVERIASRFTRSEEEEFIKIHDEHERMMYHLINWSAKETLYKLIDNSEAADFRKVFAISPYALSEQGSMSVAIMLGEGHEEKVHYAVHDDFVCTWTF